MENNYIINGNKVKKLSKWCKDRKLSIHAFYKAIKVAKTKESNNCICKGYKITRL